MGANIETIWQVPAYLPSLQPPLSDEAIASAEEQIGYPLPAEYLALLKKQNGGYIRFSLPDSVHDSIAGIGPRHPSLTEFDWDECRDEVGFPLDGLVPFDGDGHWHLCLDYRENPTTPAVTYVDIECDRQERIADSFAGYLAKLQIDGDDQYVLEAAADADIEAVTRSLSSALSMPFDPPDSWANGYPSYRGRLGSPKDPQWVWISPNLVPRGFVRTDDPDYDELKDLMPGHATRYPELPGRSFLIKATHAVRSKVIDACHRCQMIVKPLREYLDHAEPIN